MLEFGSFTIDFDRRLVFERGRTIVLAPKVFDLLAYLVRNYGRVISRDELTQNVWDGSALGSANIAQHILLVRRALGDLRKPYKYVGAVHGEGYTFVREPQQSTMPGGNGRLSLNPLQLYSNARYLCEQRTAPAVKAALQLFESAIENDPSDAKLYAGKAQAHLLVANYLYAQPHEHFRLAHTAAKRALHIDSSCVDALVVEAALALTTKYDPESTFALLQRVEALRPDLPALYQLRAQCFIVMERFDDALLSAHEGVAWHPASVPMNAVAGYALYAAGRYSDAETHLRMVLELDPKARNAAYFHAMSTYMLGEAHAAIEELRGLIAHRDSPVRGEPDVLQHAGAALAFILNQANKPHEARATLQRLEELSEGRVLTRSHRAIALAGIDESAVAEALRESVAKMDPWIVFAPVSHFFDMYAGRDWYRAVVKTLRTPRTL